ncbi:protein PHOTOSYSTEM I ASSEMBLY 2, chloroplastic isoform X2 [Jatropha curcas]|uniref:protein PHOTOSYSTEM I ASSEMBLY 2, chloroplastic isoform X2 n=1 Tax=Jatropha curcas TaxID=180498 RepID=UPI0005FB802B|nr:protein PHOTOSYSTEM I ASSEMBLY 2, chloroplastic isoform X2 [Jatropha curcas]
MEEQDEHQLHLPQAFLEAFALCSSAAATPRRAVVLKVDSGIMCEPCNGKGWLLCDFCKGQKTNVKAENKRIYRRCPSCRAIGYILCPKCRVFKCVTFPNYSDGEDPSL